MKTKAKKEKVKTQAPAAEARPPEVLRQEQARKLGKLYDWLKNQLSDWERQFTDHERAAADARKYGKAAHCKDIVGLTQWIGKEAGFHRHRVLCDLENDPFEGFYQWIVACTSSLKKSRVATERGAMAAREYELAEHHAQVYGMLEELRQLAESWTVQIRTGMV